MRGTFGSLDPAYLAFAYRLIPPPLRGVGMIQLSCDLVSVNSFFLCPLSRLPPPFIFPAFTSRTALKTIIETRGAHITSIDGPRGYWDSFMASVTASRWHSEGLALYCAVSSECRAPQGVTP